jgi:hypothetical protein
MATRAKDRFSRAAVATAAAERAIQKRIDNKERRKPKKSPSPKAMQAGARHYPAPSFPKQQGTDIIPLAATSCVR